VSHAGRSSASTRWIIASGWNLRIERQSARTFGR
jgi:hypothetical protein